MGKWIKENLVRTVESKWNFDVLLSIYQITQIESNLSFYQTIQDTRFLNSFCIDDLERVWSKINVWLVNNFHFLDQRGSTLEILSAFWAQLNKVRRCNIKTQFSGYLEHPLSWWWYNEPSWLHLPHQSFSLPTISCPTFCLSPLFPTALEHLDLLHFLCFLSLWHFLFFPQPAMPTTHFYYQCHL